jgi:hypothetical protein
MTPLRYALSTPDAPLAAAVLGYLRDVPGAELVSLADHPACVLHLTGDPPPPDSWRFRLHPPGRYLRLATLETQTTTLDLRILPAALPAGEALACLADAPARILRHLTAGIPLPPAAAAPTVLPPAGIAGKIHQQVENTLFTEIWQVGLVHAPIARFLDPNFQPEIQWLPNARPSHFYADPFLSVEPDRLRILIEEYDYQSDPTGRIGELFWRDGQFQLPAQRIFPAPNHMSYPYLCHSEGELFAIPESWQRNAVRIHRWRPGLQSWDEGRTLLDGIPAVDTTVVHHQDRWWLFCTEKGPAVDCRLLLFYADSLEGPWKPHLANPVKVDVRSARPGGTPFLAGGVLYRPAQDCSESYGCRLSLNRILTLTPTAFAEETVRVLHPAPHWPCRDGFHTLSGHAGWTILDAKRMTLLPSLATKRILHKIKRLSVMATGKTR